MQAEQRKISRIGRQYDPQNHSWTSAIWSGELMSVAGLAALAAQVREFFTVRLMCPTVLRPLLTLCVLFIIQSWSGAIVIFFYGVSIFKVLASYILQYFAVLVGINLMT